MTMLNNNGIRAGHSSNTDQCKFLHGLLAGSNLEDASRSLKAISHPLRLNILCVLGKGEVSVQDILDSVGTTQSNVSQHLCLLKDKGIVKSRKDANRVFYSIKDETVKKILGSSVE
jgi:ArsR family transcriptional regulator